MTKSHAARKLPTLKLAVVQYGILLLMLALAAGFGVCRSLAPELQNAGGAEPYSQSAGAGSARQALRPRKPAGGRQLSFGFMLSWCANRIATSTPILPLIARGLHLDLDQLRATLHHYRAAPGYQPIPIKEDVQRDEQAFIEAHRNELPELETIEGERRLYPRDGFAAHLIGYVGEVSEEDLNQTRYAAYAPGDVVGKAGVEESTTSCCAGRTDHATSLSTATDARLATSERSTPFPDRICV